MDLGLKGKSALVAAGTKGIGLAIAQTLAREGAKVSVCARNPIPLDGLDVFPADVSKEEDINAWIDHARTLHGDPQVLITNTGGPPAGLWPEKTDEEWQLGVDSTLLNVVRMVRALHPTLIKSGWGRIVHITSLVAFQPEPLLPISSTLRSGLVALTRLQAQELAPHNVTVNAVLPGHTLTDRQIHLAQIRASKNGTSVEEELTKQAQNIPLQRLATPQEIANAAVFLASEPASYITGVSLLVDGGVVKGLH